MQIYVNMLVLNTSQETCHRLFKHKSAQKNAWCKTVSSCWATSANIAPLCCQIRAKKENFQKMLINLVWINDVYKSIPSYQELHSCISSSPDLSSVPMVMFCKSGVNSGVADTLWSEVKRSVSTRQGHSYTRKITQRYETVLNSVLDCLQNLTKKGLCGLVTLYSFGHT